MKAIDDLFASIVMTAVVSPCETYRSELRRIWDKTKPLLPVCMLNPSRADHRVNDPTILTLVHFAKLWGYGGIIVINLHDYRSPSPKAMMASDVVSVSPYNARYIDAALTYARHANLSLLAAWGNGGDHLGRDEWFCARARHHMVDLVCLGKTREGHPKHPLARGKHFIPRDLAAPLPWRSSREVV